MTSEQTHHHLLIDKYNKLQILHNIFTYFIIKSQHSSDNDLQSLISCFQSTESNFFLSQQPPDETMGLLFSDLLTLKNLSVTSFPQHSSLKLLSYFEEEIRQFLKDHQLPPSPDILSQTHQIPSELFTLLLDNFNLFTAIYTTYTNSHTTQKQNIIDSLNIEYTEINSAITSIINIIMTQLTSEQNTKTMQKIKESIIQKNKETKEEIAYLSSQLDKYKLQGESMISLVNEYNKLCNMIDCSK